MACHPPKQRNTQQYAFLESSLEEINARWDSLTKWLHEEGAYLTNVQARLRNLQRLQARGDTFPPEARILSERVAALEAEVRCTQTSLEDGRRQRAWLEQQFDDTRLRLAGLQREGTHKPHRGTASLSCQLASLLQFPRQMVKKFGKYERPACWMTGQPEVWWW
jgi:hypothetical protein